MSRIKSPKCEVDPRQPAVNDGNRYVEDQDDFNFKEHEESPCDRVATGAEDVVTGKSSVQILLRGYLN